MQSFVNIRLSCLQFYTHTGVSLDLHCQDALYSSYLQALAGKSHKLAITQYKAYVEEMCNKVEEVIKHHIDEWMAHRGERSSQDNLKMEVLKVKKLRYQSIICSLTLYYSTCHSVALESGY